jgi:aryl-alcohol dehydrogenase-like predicted oxidoreductase
MRLGPNDVGLSRDAIMAEIDASLRRLGTDYVHVYQSAPKRRNSRFIASTRRVISRHRGHRSVRRQRDG